MTIARYLPPRAVDLPQSFIISLINPHFLLLALSAFSSRMRGTPRSREIRLRDRSSDRFDPVRERGEFHARALSVLIKRKSDVNFTRLARGINYRPGQRTFPRPRRRRIAVRELCRSTDGGTSTLCTRARNKRAAALSDTGVLHSWPRDRPIISPLLSRGMFYAHARPAWRRIKTHPTRASR